MSDSFSSTQFNALAPYYDELMEIVPYDAWAEYIETLFRVAEARPKRILDCCCGTGNVSFELAERGYEVTGVDLSAPMIAVARAKNRRLNSNLRFFEADLSDFELEDTFEAATCLYDSLNYILEPSKLQSAFERVAHHVEPGGLFVFDMNSELALTQDLFTQSSRHPRKALHYDWHARYDPTTRITSVEMLFTRHTSSPNAAENRSQRVEQFRETHRERAYSLAEIETMLAQAQWDLLKIYDAYTLNPPHDGSERWFFLARRTESPLPMKRVTERNKIG